MDWRRRLEILLQERDLDMRSVSRKAGLGDTYVRDAIRRGRGGSVDALRAIAKTLDVSVEWLMTGLDPQFQNVTLSQPERYSAASSPTIRVVGDVAAGVWSEVEMAISLDDAPASVFPPDPRFPIEAQYDLNVRGTSLNRVARDGDMLRCVDIKGAGIDVRENDLVIVKRTRDQLHELTAKRVRRRGGHIELHPDSTDPRWQEPIVIRSDGDAGAVEIIALVLYSYVPLTSHR